MTDFWANQRVLVTGASGFLGRAVIRALDQSGIERITSHHGHGIHWNLTHAETVADFVNGWHGARSEGDVSLVIHCAANVGGIGKNRDLPASIMYDNLLMNTHVLHEAYEAGVQKFVGIGSVCAYPKDTPAPFREHNLFNGYPEETNAPYGITKRALLVMSQAYRQQYGFNAIHVMPTNLYGPGDHFDLEHSHVIPAIMRKMHEAKARDLPSVTLWGDGSASREFLYVDDAARAILHCAEHYNDPTPINIGTGIETRIDEMAALIAYVIGYTGAVIWDTSKPNGQPRRNLDIRKIAKLGWSPQMPLEQGLHETYDWYVREVVSV